MSRSDILRADYSFHSFFYQISSKLFLKLINTIFCLNFCNLFALGINTYTNNYFWNFRIAFKLALQNVLS